VKELVVIGGPNGAGKTTAAPALLAAHSIREFVNADQIARGISPLNPEGSEIAAGRILVERLHAFARAGQSFAFETTCAGRGHARLMRACRDAGYRVTLIFLWLPSLKHALDRVARRVRSGGHSVPENIVRRRYRVGLRNLRTLYLPLADIGLIYDNSARTRVLIAETAPGVEFVHDELRWAKIRKAET
jgi:predicted ABC-type ATPase